MILCSYFINFVSFCYNLFSYFTDCVVSFRWISFSFFTDFVGFCFRFVSQFTGTPLFQLYYRKQVSFDEMIVMSTFSVFIWCREPAHFTGYCYKIPGYEFSKHGLNVQNKSSCLFYFNSVSLSFAGMYSEWTWDYIIMIIRRLKTNLSVWAWLRFDLNFVYEKALLWQRNE